MQYTTFGFIFHINLSKHFNLWNKNNKVDVKRRNTLSCLDQYMAPNSKYIEAECSPTKSW